MIKIVLVLWFIALILSLLARRGSRGRAVMVRIFIGGFCLLILGFFLKLISRLL